MLKDQSKPDLQNRYSILYSIKHEIYSLEFEKYLFYFFITHSEDISTDHCAKLLIAKKVGYCSKKSCIHRQSYLLSETQS